MRRAFVHVGMPRTGSTTFQHIMFHHRAALAGAGVLYPDLTPRSAAVPHINHQHLGEALDGRRPQREAVELLGRLDEGLRRTDADVVLLSYEGFIQQKLAPRISQRLRAVFDRHGFRMEAAAAVKPQAEMLNSLYAHRLQLMLEKRLFAGFAAAMEGSARFDYHRLVLPWLQACDGRVHAVPVRAAGDPAPLVERLLRTLGLHGRTAPILAAGEARRVENRSPGPVAAEVSRRLRLLRAHTRLRVSPREMMRAVEGAAQERGLDRIGFRGVDPALRDRMAARYHDGNARFAAAVWGRDWSAVVAPEPETIVNEVARAPLDPAVGRHIEAILQEACARFGVAPRRPWGGGAMELLHDGGEAMQRVLRLSRWRVV